jgi:hypothetical protein
VHATTDSGPVSRFATYIQEKEEMDQRPVFTEDGYTFVYIKYNNLYLMAVTKRNSNVALMLVYLYRMVDVFKVSLPPIWTRWGSGVTVVLVLGGWLDDRSTLGSWRRRASVTTS